MKEMVRLGEDWYVVLEENSRWYELLDEEYTSTPLTRKKVIDLMGEKINELPSEVQKNLRDTSLHAKIEDQFRLFGLSWEEMEKWAADCYRLGQNPLPAIRKSVGDICKVVFAYASSGASFVGTNDTLVCWLSNDGIQEEWSVSLVEYDGIVYKNNFRP